MKLNTKSLCVYPGLAKMRTHHHDDAWSHTLLAEKCFGKEKHAYHFSPRLKYWLRTKWLLWVSQDKSSPEWTPFWCCWKDPVNPNKSFEQSLGWRLPALLWRISVLLELCSVKEDLLWRWSRVIGFSNKRILEIILITFEMHLVQCLITHHITCCPFQFLSCFFFS